MLPVRHVSRILLIDAEGAVLLVRYESQTTKETWWVPPGGALEKGEDYRTAATRELLEETGLSAEIGRELWERQFDFAMQTETVHQVERYFLVTLNCVKPPVHNSSPEDILEHRWWHLEELARSDAVIYPEGLADELGRLSDATW